MHTDSVSRKDKGGIHTDILTSLHTAVLHISPLLDIQHEEIAHAYREGFESSVQAGIAPLAVGDIVNHLHGAVAKGCFDGQHEAQLYQLIGSISGEIHGTVLTPGGTRRSDVTTLVTLKSTNEQCGYRAGRIWFFYEAAPDERTLTDKQLLRRFHEYVTDSLAWHDPEGVWYYITACLLGELSGHLFPLTRQEQQSWQHDTEPLDPLYE